MLENIIGITHKTIPIIAYVDNKSVIEDVHSTKLVDDKRLRVDIAAISESVIRTEVSEINWCLGNIHLADCMRKTWSCRVKSSKRSKRWEVATGFCLTL